MTMTVVGVLLLAGGGPAFAATDDPTPGATASAVPEDGASSTPTPTAVPQPTAAPTASTTPAPSATASPTPTAAPRASARAVQAAAAAVPVPSGSRISTGTDPYTASVRVSAALFPSGADTVLLVPGAFPAFGAIAASLAASRGAAVLNVQSTAIPSVVLTELRRLAPSSIVVIGGPAYVSDAVLTAARAVTANVTRIGGANPYETARLVFDANTAGGATVYISDFKTIDDLPQATVLAAVNGTRALAVNAHTAALDAATIASLRAAGTTSVVIVESTSPVPTTYANALTAAGFRVTRITRTDRYSLTATVAALIGASRTASVVVNPERPGDTALATAFAGVTHQPLYYTIAQCMLDGIAAQVTASQKPVYLIGDTSALAAAVASNAKCSTEKSRLESSLNSAIRATLSQWSGSYTVTVRQIGGLGEITQINGGVRREPASMMKIFAAWAAYSLVQQGKARTTTLLPSGVPLGVCIQIMIHVSDNNCHSDIVHWIGIPRINSMIHGAGFTNTTYGSVPNGTSVLYAGNRTTTNDLAYMMERLANRTVISKPYADAIINFMRSQIWRSRIASGIPPGVPQASKPGSLWVSSGLIQNDTGLVNGPTSSYILSIMGDGNPPQAALRAISRTVYTHFNGAFGAAMVYPVQQMVTKTPSILRSSAGGAKVATIPAGVLIQVLDANRVWYEIQYGSRKLWVYYTGLRNR
jgi:putative cell wall-binding protein